MVQKSNPTTLLNVAEEIFGQTYLLTKHLRETGISEPSLALGASTELWSSHAAEIEKAQTEIFGLAKKLTKLLHGPHGFLHEYVSSNWEYGALYTLLEFDVLEKIPFGETVHVSQLAEQSGLPMRKLLSLLRLAACEDILEEISEENFGHTAISEELVKDPGYKAFIGFQLFETRIASAHLADSMKKPNDFWSGQSAFKYAWGASMYDWHRTHPEKGKRFGMAMESVTKSLDPGNKLLFDYFSQKDSQSRDLVVDISGKTGSTSRYLAEEFSSFKFQVQDISQSLLDQGQQSLPDVLKERIEFEQHDLFKPQETQNLGKTLAYIIKSVLWNLCDDDCIKLLQTFVPVLEKSPETVILVNDLVSPRSGTFEPHVEKAYRRRDVTLMTMHNVKQREEEEWLSLLKSVSPHFQVKFTQAFTSHSCRGLWEISWMQSD